MKELSKNMTPNSNQSTTPKNEERSVYNSYNPSRRFVYALPYRITGLLGSSEFDTGKEVLVQDRSGKQIHVSIRAVPDGIWSRVNRAVKNNLLDASGYVSGRFFAYSDTPLEGIESIFLQSPYDNAVYCPIESLTSPFAVISDQKFPLCNFYTCRFDRRFEETVISAVNLTHDMLLVEYRHFLNRMVESNVYFDSFTGRMYHFVPPANHALLILIMPSNFICINEYCGYFHFPENDLVVRLYSKVPLSADRREGAPLLDTHVNEMQVTNEHLMSLIRSFFNRMKIYRVYSTNPKQIVGYDQFLTVVVGDVSDVYQ